MPCIKKNRLWLIVCSAKHILNITKQPLLGHQVVRYYILLFVALFALAADSALAKGNGFQTAFNQIDTSFWKVSHGWTNGDWMSCEWRSDAVTTKGDKLVLTLSDKGGAKRPLGCGEIQSKARYGYGLYEAKMKVAVGAGLNSAFFTYIGPPNGVPEHDEIDFEFLGKDPGKVEVNYFVAGDSTRGKTVDLGFDPSQDFHHYAFEWRSTGIKWFVDGLKVYETPAGAQIPRNPGKVIFSLWSNGPGLNDWMGKLNYTKPVSAEVAWTRFTPYEQ